MGKYEVSVKFEGTFKGTAGHIRGSPYQITVADGNADGADAITNDINGPLVMEYIRKQIANTSEYVIYFDFKMRLTVYLLNRLPIIL